METEIWKKMLHTKPFEIFWKMRNRSVILKVSWKKGIDDIYSWPYVLLTDRDLEKSQRNILPFNFGRLIQKKLEHW